MARVKHVVLLRFMPAREAKIKEVMAALAGLKDKVPGIVDFSGGQNSSMEGLSKGYTHGFVMTFEDEASRDAYLPHPEHEKVKEMVFGLLDGGLDGVHVMDWVES